MSWALGLTISESALLLADELINTELFVAVRESAVGTKLT